MTPWYRRWIEDPDTAGPPPPLRSWHSLRGKDPELSEMNAAKARIGVRPWRVKGQGLR